MRYTLLSWLAAALTLAANASVAQTTGGAGIIYGAHHAFTVEAPPGWVLDNQAGQSSGLVAVFYRTGESWEHGTAVMYVNTSSPDSGEAADPLRVIADDSAHFVSEAPAISIRSAPSLRTSDGRVAYVRYFAGGPSGRYEAVAYVAEKTLTPMIVLTARTQAAFEAALPAFAQLVRSYWFMTSDVRIQHN